MISSSRQQGDNPATLNPVGTADPNSYTVGGAMDTGCLLYTSPSPRDS